jgi:hypothetical protein
MIIPDWPAPSHIHACTTIRSGGRSLTPYHSFNLADHVGDNEQHVQANRQLLRNKLDLPNEPIWLEQTHSTIVLPAAKSDDRKADASFTDQPGQVCVVMTADCLPVLLCNRQGTYVAAIHAGWRGLANGVIENTVKAINLPPSDILVWLGPAIGPAVYELGQEVLDCFVEDNPEARHSFVPSSKSGHWLGNLYSLARLRLKKLNIHAIYGGDYCTYTDKERFFSYRRDGSTGRMASLIWMT